MHESKLLTLIGCFDKKELDQLDRFMRSPFFFKEPLSAPVMNLFAYIRSCYPKYQAEALTSQKVYEQVFQGEAWEPKKLSQLMTRLMRIVVSFIDTIYRDQVFGKRPATLSLAVFYQKNNRKRAFERLVTKVQRTQSQMPIKDARHFWTNFLLAKELTTYYNLYNIRKTDLNLPSTLLQLDYFYLALRLEYACVLLGQQKHQTPIEAENSMASLEALLPLLESGRYREEPTIDLLYRALLLLRSETSATEYQELKTTYYGYGQKISTNHRELVHSVLRNFCLRRMNEDQSDYARELFRLYQDGLTTAVLLHQGKILPATMQALVALGLKLEEYDWVDDFLEVYHHKIGGTEVPEEIYSFNRASLFFARGDFDAALAYLVYNFADIYLRLAARRMEVQICYEQQSDLLESKTQAFKIFVYRISQSRLTEVQREGYTNFIDLLKQIIHPSTRFNQKRISSLIAKINAKKTVAEKKWLLNKLEEM